MTTFDFSQEQRWDPDSSLLIEPGNWRAVIAEAEPGQSSGGYPQIELRVERGEYSLRSWVVITDNSKGKVLQLTEAAGLANPGNVTIPSDEWTAYVKQLEGKQVGIIVRDVPRRDDPTKMKRSIEAWCTPEELPAEADVPADTTGLGNAANSSGQVDQDIPF